MLNGVNIYAEFNSQKKKKTFEEKKEKQILDMINGHYSGGLVRLRVDHRSTPVTPKTQVKQKTHSSRYLPILIPMIAIFSLHAWPLINHNGFQTPHLNSYFLIQNGYFNNGLSCWVLYWSGYVCWLCAVLVGYRSEFNLLNFHVYLHSWFSWWGFEFLLMVI